MAHLASCAVSAATINPSSSAESVRLKSHHPLNEKGKEGKQGKKYPPRADGKVREERNSVGKSAFPNRGG
jgi:hypothetical protein